MILPLAIYLRMFDRMVGKKIVMMREVLRSGKQHDKNVSLNLKLMDADGRPSQVTRTSCLLGIIRQW